MIYLTRREKFSAAHRMYKKEWSDSKNQEVFGDCSNPNWHGHNYILFVTVKGNINSETGYLVNLKTLGSIIRENVIQKIDHKNMNLEVDFMNGKVASSENLAVSIWEVLDPKVKMLGVELHKIKIEETENNFIEYFGK
ncbi:MAG: 6-carboxytetrahydropterin synthase [Bacteroidetes bacterium]|nr:6-carboxytetrahydropterin synthase [Bacteroidota bacterium]